MAQWLVFIIACFVSVSAWAGAALDCPYTVEDSYSHFKQKFPAWEVASSGELAQTKTLVFGNLGFGDSDLLYLCPLTQLESLSVFNDGAGTSTEKLTGDHLEILNVLSGLEFLCDSGNSSLFPSHRIIATASSGLNFWSSCFDF
jgi:hypothetical protein